VDDPGSLGRRVSGDMRFSRLEDHLRAAARFPGRHRIWDPCVRRGRFQLKRELGSILRLATLDFVRSTVGGSSWCEARDRGTAPPNARRDIEDIYAEQGTRARTACKEPAVTTRCQFARHKIALVLLNSKVCSGRLASSGSQRCSRQQTRP
jgi:hypothetical protein